MKHSTILVSTLALCALLSGCVGTGPNTQQGAVTGGALGALAGAVIGNNSRGGDALGGALLGAYAGALAGGTIGNSIDHQEGTIYGAPHRRVRELAPVEAPPPPPAPPTAFEIIPPAPISNAVWIPGYWDFNGSGYAWLPGHWEVPPQNAHNYVAAHWENRGGSTVYVPSYWR